MDYYPYGKVLRSFAGSGLNKYGYQGSEREKEISDDDYYTLFRGLDGDIARWKQVDPKWNPNESPYASMGCNPVMLTDVLGNTPGEYEKSGYNSKTKLYEKSKKISDLGGNDIDYNHHTGGALDGRTQIVNKATGDAEWMKSDYVKGYTQRDSKTDWKTITNEFTTGTGPEKSLISGSDNHMIQDIMKSPQFATATQEFMENGTDKKYLFKGDFGISGAFSAGNNATAQMIGKANMSFYPVGNQLIIMAVDSKSATSWSLNPFSKGESNNVPRVNGQGPPESTTHQTYLWNLPIKSK